MSKFVMAEFQPYELIELPFQRGTKTPALIRGAPSGKPGEVQRIPRSQLKEKWWIYVEDAPNEVVIPTEKPIEVKPPKKVKAVFHSWRMGEAPYQRGIEIPIKIRGAPSGYSEGATYEILESELNQPYWSLPEVKP